MLRITIYALVTLVCIAIAYVSFSHEAWFAFGAWTFAAGTWYTMFVYEIVDAGNKG